jgi:hypothetical protein
MPLTLEQLRRRNEELIAREREESGGNTEFWYLSYAYRALSWKSVGEG